jgi:hypothetical protein
VAEKYIDLLKLIDPVKENHIFWDIRCDDNKVDEHETLTWRDVAENLESDMS